MSLLFVGLCLRQQANSDFEHVGLTKHSAKLRARQRHRGSRRSGAELRTQVVRKQSEPPFVALVETTGGVAFDKLRQRRGELFNGLQRGLDGDG